MSDQPPDRAEPFRGMADRITANDASSFAGAFVIVPPGGEVVELLMLSGKMEPSAFWAQLKVMAEMTIREIDAAERGGYRASR